MDDLDDLEHLGSAKAGESHVEALLASLFIAGKPTPDIGDDLIAYFRPAVGPPDVMFRFQTKYRAGSTSSARTLSRWIDVVERQPVVIFRVTVTFNRIHYGLIIFHDWLLDHPGYAAQPHAVRFPPGDFLSLDSISHLKRLMLLEADRVLKLPNATFRYARIPEIPLPEQGALASLGSLAAHELSAATWQEFVADPQTKTEEELWYKLQRRESISPHHDYTPLDEHGQFPLFVQAMRLYGAGERQFPMPRAWYREVGVWRLLSALFPASLGLLERVVERPSQFHGDQIRAAFQLLSAAANSTDRIRSYRAHDLLSRFADEFSSSSVHSYREFAVQYSIFFAMAEAEGGAHETRMLDFLAKPRTQRRAWALRLNREYYEAPEVVTATALSRKLAQPHLRDLKVVSLHHCLLDAMPRQVVEEARRLIDES